MILDTFDNIEFYRTLGARFERGLRWLKNNDLMSLSDGKVKIDGDTIYASVQSYTTKPASEGRYEAHRRYADIQVVAGGEEVIGWMPLKDLAIDMPYDESRDLMFLKGTLNEGTALVLRPHMFAVFYPSDAHMPMLIAQKPMALRKVVVKIALE